MTEPHRVEARRLDAQTALIDGHLVRLDPTDSIGVCRAGGYEPYESWLLERLVMPGSTVVDAGANIGVYTLRFARQVGPRGRVIAFEPAPDTARLLAHNVRANGYAHVEIHEAALADRSRQGALFLSATNTGDHRIHAAEESRAQVAVDVVALDDVLQIEGALSLVKLDVQGAEPAVLAGMVRTLAAHPETWIACEFWPYGLERCGASAAALLALLRTWGSGLLWIDEATRRLVAVDDARLLTSYPVARRSHTNLLVPPRAWRGVPPPVTAG